MAKTRVPGREYVDETPVEWPLGVSAPESLEQKIARMVRTSVSDYAQSQGAESFDEADDFDVEDPEALPESRHELDDDQEAIARDLAERRRIPPEFRNAYEREKARIAAAREKELKGDEKSSVEDPPKADKVAPS